MSAVTRWVQYDIAETGVAGTGGGTLWGRGTRAFSFGTANTADTFNIGTTNNRLYIKVDGFPASPYGITLASGTELDPRFIAKDITEKMHDAGQAATAWDQAQCVWEDGEFHLYSGTLGSDATITVWSGTNTAHLELGWGTKNETGGLATDNGYEPNNISVSGTYNGFFDEMYQVVVNREVSIGTPVKDGLNSYGGTLTTGGVYNWGDTLTYTISISTLKGKTLGAGIISCPTMSWEDATHVDDGGPVDLLFANYWYKVGTKGLMVKFTDDIFNTVDPAWTITCSKVEYAQGTNPNAPAGPGGAKFVWGSTRGDDAVTAVDTTVSGSWTPLGSRGLYISFNTSSNLVAGDEFFVICTPPQPSAYDISNLNYGNVTVSTESPLRNVIFEILSGAKLIDTVKFGLQSHGNFDHHGEGIDDTLFRYGTVGPGNTAGSSPHNNLEWKTNVAALDLSDETDIPPDDMYATRHNLAVVADADSSEAVGVSTYAGMVADPMWLNIKLGTSEVGANSTINYRIYFDYS